MKILAVIPARYNSSRFPGKPLADINGKPMIWWVYNQVLKVKNIDDIIVATDDSRIKEVCDYYKIKSIITSSKHTTLVDRIYEVATHMTFDYYISLNGDEPLIEPKCIEAIIPNIIYKNKYTANLITKIQNPSEVVDFTNIKIVCDKEGNGLYVSRSPVPYPKGKLDFDYKKHIGVSIFNFKALDFFANTKRGEIEKIEDIDQLRFIENGKKIKFIEVDSCNLSVDTHKDIEEVRRRLHEDS
jgi:3-deoxy-manno-octulosonate cytidylyltransferase (CMP-KDO synthetase)